jgi:glycosyltransferase involved in cell wall biosynthesis
MRSQATLRVLHVVPSYWPATAYGGPVESVHGLCLALARTGAEVEVLTTDADGGRRLGLPDGREIRPAPGLRIRYTRRWGWDSVAPGLLARLPGAMARADVVHLTAIYSFPTLPTLALARLLGKPLVWSPRGSLQRWEGTSRRSLKASWHGACRVMMPPRALLHLTAEPEAEASRASFPGVATVVIPNGIDLPREAPRRPRGGTIHLVFLGRLHPIKGLENLIDACGRCSNRGWDDWRLSIAGSGEADYEVSLRDRVRDAGIAPRVSFLGAVHGERKAELLESADVVVVPSHSENFSMVVVEALAHGVPVLASEGTPWSELVERRCGWWVENRPDVLAAALAALRDAELEAMGRRGREWMGAGFGWDRIARRMMSAYGLVYAGRTG